MLVLIAFLAAVRSIQYLDRDTQLNSLRIRFFPIPGAFSEENQQELVDILLPSVQIFYSNALKVNRVLKPLKPSIASCATVPIPEDHLKEGVEADVIIYVSAERLILPAVGRSCEIEGEIFQRPVVGGLIIDSDKFFSYEGNMRINYLMRETARIIALDYYLFSSYVDSDGNRYSQTQYMTILNFPERGKTVRTIAFPNMLEKARSAFDCEIEGLELEDNLSALGSGNSIFFWDSRIMTHDIMSSSMSDQVIFSDITMALFEDSHWYKPDYSYSQQIKWGLKAGCNWFEKKCVENKHLLPGFCREESTKGHCDVFELGYGNCEMHLSYSIPPSQQYFSDPTKGGHMMYDFCPIIDVAKLNNCRDLNYIANVQSGELKSINSRCLMSSLVKTDVQETRELSGGCFYVNECKEKAVTLLISNLTVDCPYDSKITVSGFNGYLHCPDSSFCTNVPCFNLCTGKGKCVDGKCMCNDGFSGPDCSIQCAPECKSCLVKNKCILCADGYYMNSDACSPCSKSCKTCKGSPSTCDSCNVGSELVGSQCIQNCLKNCASCDKPCSKCDSGYFITDGICKACDENCKECRDSADLCTACSQSLIIISGKCKPFCPIGCNKCEYPCTECKEGFYNKKGDCFFCNNICASCKDESSACTSCWPGFVLNNGTCSQSCKEHCLTCDNPCTGCEDGYFLSNNECLKCDDMCLTCSKLPALCTSCNSGFNLVGASCEKKCLDHCLSCNFPCEKCADGFYEEFGKCFECHENCKTCKTQSTYCETCFPGYGLVLNSCEKECPEHCTSCDFPCSQCEFKYYEHNGACIRCDQSCNSCTGLGNDKCLECAEGFVKDKGICRLLCQEHCFSCDEPCSVCEVGFFKYQNGCQKCKSSCRTCENLSSCASCNQGFGLVNNNCLEGCADHCVSCSIPCTTCESGFLPINGFCQACTGGCLECFNEADMCKSCKDGFSLVGNTCKVSCPKNCVSCDFPCSVCDTGFVSIDGHCKECPTGCLSCSKDYSKCYSCGEGYYYSDNKCEKICLPNCKSCDNPCSECSPGYIQEDSICTLCEHPCTSCLGTKTKCTSCAELYELVDFKCTTKCLDHCKSCDNPCTVCQDGFLLFQGKCEACHVSCKTCMSAPNKCNSCTEGKKLYGSSCVIECTDNCIDCSSPCRACREGYKLEGGLCVACPNYLKSSNVNAEFIRDFTGLALVFSLPLVYQINDCKEYFKFTTLALLGNDALCVWDQTNRLIVLFGTNPEFGIKSLEMLPVLTFGSDCSSKEEIFKVTIHQNSVPAPIVSLVAPNYFSLGCDNEVLVIEGVTEEDAFTFEVTTEPKIKAIENFAATFTGRIINFPESILKPVHINVTFSATNFLGRTSTVSKIIIVTHEKKISVSVDAGSRIQLNSGQSISIRGILPQTSCIDPEKLTYQWKYIQSDTSPYLARIEDLIKQSNLPNVLLITPGSLKSGASYVFRFEVYDDKSNDFSDIQIDIIDSPLVAVLDRSDSSFNVNNPFTLSAKSSYDPGDPSVVLKYEWQCMQETLPCFDVSGEPLIDETNSDEIRIGESRMAAGVNYAFTVKVSNGKRISSQSVIISTVKEGGSILIPTYQDSVNPQLEFPVFPAFEDLDESWKFKWVQITGPAIKPKLSSSYVVFDSSHMVPGHSYIFRIKGSYQNASVYSDLRWTANSGPKCSELVTYLVGNSLSLSIDCDDKDNNDFPLSYAYGIKKEKSFIPLRVTHSPSTTFKLNPGIYTMYVVACDSLKTCIRKTALIEISKRRNQEVEDIRKYKTEKIFPDNIPLAIFNSIDVFDKDNFLQAFLDLEGYILSQEPDLVFLKMAIESLELLTSSDKQHFMSVHQAEIVKFLTDIAVKLDYIDDEAMNYVVQLFSEHQVKDYPLVSHLICKFSEKWVKKLPPGESRSVKNRISIIRHRFIGTDIKENYIINSVNISNLVLEGDPHKIYDLVLIVFPSYPSQIVDINYFEVGSYDNLNVVFSDTISEVQIELQEPFSIRFSLATPGDFSCAQLRGTLWIDEGCKLTNQSDSDLVISSWHVSTYKLVNSFSTKRGVSSFIAEGVLLFLTVAGVGLFCFLDQRKNYFNLAQLESEKGEKELVENMPKETLSALLFHPSLNIFIQQTGDRRAASVLYISSVLFAEFITIGGMFNQKFNRVFDESGTFVGFSKAQWTTGCVGLIFSQFLSIGIIFLNQPLDNVYTKRYIGVAVSTLIIIFAAGLGISFGLSYPDIYTRYWTLSFIPVLFIELIVIQGVFWLVNYKIGLKKFESNKKLGTRGVRVFTTDS